MVTEISQVFDDVIRCNDFKVIKVLPSGPRGVYKRTLSEFAILSTQFKFSLHSHLNVRLWAKVENLAQLAIVSQILSERFVLLCPLARRP